MTHPRTATQEVLQRLEVSPVVALLGARQVGKTTLSRLVARQVASDGRGPVHSFDLEDPADLARLTAPGLALRPLEGLVILDEVQRMPSLFPLLRVLADREPLPARFLLLGSASPHLVSQTAETLAGRIAFVHLEGFDLSEVGVEDLSRLWIRGGFPRSFLAPDEAESVRWRTDFIRTFLERDLLPAAARVSSGDNKVHVLVPVIIPPRTLGIDFSATPRKRLAALFERAAKGGAIGFERMDPLDFPPPSEVVDEVRRRYPELSARDLEQCRDCYENFRTVGEITFRQLADGLLKKIRKLRSPAR